MKMNVLMENWRKYVEDDEPVLEESFLKNLGMLGASLLAGGTLATAIGSAMSPSAPEAEITSTDYKTLTDSPSFGKTKAGKRVVMDTERNWQPAPTGGNYLHVPSEEIESYEVLPMARVSARDYRTYLMQKDWTIDALYKLLFGSSGQWAYGESISKPYDTHPELGGKMLPLDWSIAFDVYRTKVDRTLTAIEKELDSQPDDVDLMIAKKLGVNSVEALRNKMDFLRDSIE